MYMADLKWQDMPPFPIFFFTYSYVGPYISNFRYRMSSSMTWTTWALKR